MPIILVVSLSIIVFCQVLLLCTPFQYIVLWLYHISGTAESSSCVHPYSPTIKGAVEHDRGKKGGYVVLLVDKGEVGHHEMIDDVR